MDEMAVRIAAFYWLSERSLLNAGVFTRKELENEFKFTDERITLMGATGIWTPKNFSVPISITTVNNGPYPDGLNEKGFLRYSYRGRDPNHRDNMGLRAAYKSKIPLIYFYALQPGRYNAYWPVYVINDDPTKLAVTVDLADSAMNGLRYEDLVTLSKDIRTEEIFRRYSAVTVMQRMHQSAFREKVITAYNRQCTICGLKHAELLDAAHIIPDRELSGEPVVPNGLSLCKIHHASFDKKIIGISPDYKIKVREDILEEEDGDMLKYGLQSTEGKKILLPSKEIHYPDKERLETAYKIFLSA